MDAIHMATGQIATGSGEAFICAGVESMAMVPQGGLNPSLNPRFRSPSQPDGELLTDAYIAMGQTAENVARRFGVPRSEQEQLALPAGQRYHP
jgi:acetyl-CoA acyltransferase